MEKLHNISEVFIFPHSSDGNNPYLTQLTHSLENLGLKVTGLSYRVLFLSIFLSNPKSKVLHIQWLHAFLSRSSYIKSLFSMGLFLSQLLILRGIGVKIVWTAHNLKNHENKFTDLDKIGTTCVAKLAHGVIAHCEYAKQELVDYLSLKNSGKVHAVPHANYIECYENKTSRTRAKKNLGLETSSEVFLFLGLIRPYKGVPELMDTFTEAALPEAKLLIVGKIWDDDPEFKKTIYEKLQRNSQIKLIEGFVPDHELQIYFNASDVVVFPYKDILTSGAVLLAMSFGKACIAPRIGCISEILDENGAFLYDKQDTEGLLTSLNLASENKVKLDEMGTHNLHAAQHLSWERISRMTLQVYQSCFQ